MAKRLATVDDVINAFDQAIENWAQSKTKELAKTYGQEEASKMAESLADWIYKDIDLDPSHLQRFVNFYVNDVKLSDALDEFLEGFGNDASMVATSLHMISSRISASKSPQKELVVKDLKAILAMLHR